MYRFVLANEEQLYARIGTLSERVRKLENALTDTHSSLSEDPHPLLTDELLLIKELLERNKPNLDLSKDDSKDEEDDEADEDEDVEASYGILGTIWLSAHLFSQIHSRKGANYIFRQDS
jgi:hypothetical protein